jgi:hypothetical protein
MIDPLAVLIRFLKSDTTLNTMLSGRIAEKHRYGISWAKGEPSLVVRSDGGQPDLYSPRQVVRYELRFFAATPALASQAWMRVVEISRGDTREPVVITGDEGLLYALNAESGPSMLYDPEIGMDYIMCFFQAQVAEASLL